MDARQMLRFHYHPLSSFCMKVLVALEEAGTPHEKVVVDFGDPAAREAFVRLWPGGKFPVLENTANGDVVAESTTIIDYLDAFFPGPAAFTPADPALAWRVRMWDRVIDHQIHHQMQKISTDSIRAGGGDPVGVTLARTQLARAFDMLEAQLATAADPWFWGEAFTLTDCAAAPALWYGHAVEPIGKSRPRLLAYLDRLMQRPSFALALEGAEPFFSWFPYPSQLSRTLAGHGDPKGG